MCIDLLPEELLQVIKKEQNDMNGTPLPQILLNVTLVSQLLLSHAKNFKDTFSYQQVNYLEFKL